MRKFFSFYQRFIGTIFVLWLFLWMAGKFGFGFGVDLRLFFRVLFWFFLIYLVWETKIGWPVIYPIIKTLFLKDRDEFPLKIGTTKKEIISSSPKIFANETGNFLILILAIILSFFFFLRHFFKALSRFILQLGTLLVFTIFGILADIFVFNFTSGLLILLLTGSWVWVVWRYKFKGEVSISGALVLLMMCPFLLIFKKGPIAEKAAIWSYMFLAAGTGQMAIGYIKEVKKHAKIKGKQTDN